jgi:GNAT superfamily N-acetyltransferase
MNIRGLQKADYDHLVSVLDRWWGGPAGQHEHPMFAYEFGEHGLVMERDGDVVGFLLGFVTATDPVVAYVHLVGIHPDHRRRGVGKMLYERFAESCSKKGATRIKAIAAVGDESSMRFHTALGFTPKEVPDYAGPGRARVVFVKPL